MSTEADLFHPDSPTEQSAAVIVPMLVELVEPRSVIDVGCNTGAWLRAFGPDVVQVGIDERPETFDGFQRRDLSQPFDLGRFDLALCLEVAEHLPDGSAATLVASLVGAAPVVVFSAAIPGQPGSGHINCQWPDYWRDLFAAHGYTQYDALRARVWDDERVDWWYAQNLFVYSTRAFDEQRMPERVVHPLLLAHTLSLVPREPAPIGFSTAVRAVPGAFGRAVRRRL